MTLNGLLCADVPLRRYSLTLRLIKQGKGHSSFRLHCTCRLLCIQNYSLTLLKSDLCTSQGTAVTLYSQSGQI